MRLLVFHLGILIELRLSSKEENVLFLLPAVEMGNGKAAMERCITSVGLSVFMNGQFRLKHTTPST